jgi:signal transduction histidine kinase
MDTLDSQSKNEASVCEAPGAGTFTICLLSRDIHLAESCHEALRGLGLASCDVALLDPDQATSIVADLLIWDVDQAIQTSRIKTFVANLEQLFLVSRKNLTEFLTRMPLGAGSTLLKPLNGRTLQIFLEQVVARKSERSFASRQIELESPESRAKDVLQCLLMANLKLQEYDQDRTNFLARAVHDFRAPLMAASGYCSILLEETMGPLNSGQADLIGRIQYSVEKLTRMAAGMLELSVGKHVVRVPDLRASSLGPSITTAIHQIEPLARDKQITVSINLSDPGAPLYMEPQQIEQILVNLLENACKFTPKGGAIEVHGYPICSPTYGSRIDDLSKAPASLNAYRVDVSDSGSGILPEHLENVFEEYTSYGGSQDRSGGGLGLAICKMIVSAHRGQIWAENIPRGARISFVLPLGQLQSRRRIEANIGQHAAPQEAAT